jgi:S-adenosylmethionine synthetase
MRHLFSTESVCLGHPDKVADQISDAVLDAMLAQDPMSRVACETLVTTGMVVLAGEITTKAIVDIPSLVRKTIKEIGYVDPLCGFDYDNCAVIVALDKQSPDISQGVTQGAGLHKELGAGDQGIMFGYACNETSALMPVGIHLAHLISRELKRVREKKIIPYLRPDGKCQLTIEYEGRKPIRVDTVVVSNQHDPDVKHETIVKDIIAKVIKKVIPAKLLDSKTIYHINPTGRFVVGGPKGDCGLTGRKIIVDTYGGYAPHGGGAFSGKDPTKVDRSAAYAARWVAKNVIAAGLATHCLVQVAYAIGVAKPLSIYVDTQGTGIMPDAKISAAVESVFDLSPASILKHLKLRRPIYLETTRSYHFGGTSENFAWEKTDMAEKLKKAAK